MKFYKTAIRVIRSSDSLLVGRIIPFAGLIGPPAYVVFYFTCLYQGYWESALLRLLGALLMVPMAFYPRHGEKLTWRHKLYYEVVLALVLPGLFTYFGLRNGLNTYWFVSIMWAGVIYGLLALKFYSTLFVYPLPVFAAGIVFAEQTGESITAMDSRLLGALSISWLSAILLGAVRLGADVYYLLSIEMESFKIQMQESERSRKILEEKNAELTARNSIISTFVRPSLLEEIQRGEDPRRFKPRIVDRAIMVCDMRNFTPLTSSMIQAEEQAEFINRYFEMMIEPIFKGGGEVDKLMGDAVLAIFPDGTSSVDAAMAMRRKLQAYNRELFAAGASKIANVISMAKGIILEANIGARQKLDRTWIGAAVNVCSRLEGLAKMYGIEVIASQEIVQDIPDYQACRLIDIIKVKGYSRKFEVYEIYGHQAPEVVRYKNATREQLAEAIQLYFQKGKMRRALSAFRSLLNAMPQHRFDGRREMDTIVGYYLLRARQCLKSPNNPPQALDLEEGCHDFGTIMNPRDWHRVHRLEDISDAVRPGTGSPKASRQGISALLHPKEWFRPEY